MNKKELKDLAFYAMWLCLVLGVIAYQNTMVA